MADDGQRGAPEASWNRGWGLDNKIFGKERQRAAREILIEIEIEATWPSRDCREFLVFLGKYPTMTSRRGEE